MNKLITESWIKLLKQDTILFMKDWHDMFFQSYNNSLEIKQEKENFLNNFYMKLLKEKLTTKQKGAVFQTLSYLEDFSLVLSAETISLFFEKFKEYYYHQQSQKIFLSIKPQEIAVLPPQIKNIYFNRLIGGINLYQKAIIEKLWSLSKELISHTPYKDNKKMFEKVEDVFDCQFDFDIEKIEQENFYDFYLFLLGKGYKNSSGIFQYLSTKKVKYQVDDNIKNKFLNLILAHQLPMKNKVDYFFFFDYLPIDWEDGKKINLNFFLQHPQLTGKNGYFLNFFINGNNSDDFFIKFVNFYKKNTVHKKIKKEKELIVSEMKTYLWRNQFKFEEEEVEKFKKKIELVNFLFFVK